MKTYIAILSLLRVVLSILISFIIYIPVFSQSGVAINSTGTAGNPSAILDVSSSNAGVLIPRMTESQKNLINNPANGLLVYQTDGPNPGFWFFNGSIWTQAIGAQGATGPTGPAGTSSSCTPANAGETLLNFHGCLYVKNVDEPGTFIWANAKIQCAGLGSGWYLPDKDELNQLYLKWNKPQYGGDCQGSTCPLDGFGSNYYWSSSVCASGYAWSQGFADGDGGTQYYDNMTKSFLVRCVRR